MIEVTVGELCINDLGSKVVVTRDGQAIDGVLESFYAHRSGREEAAKKSMALTLKVVLLPSKTEVDFKQLPPEYLLQIDRPAPDPGFMTIAALREHLEGEVASDSTG